MLLSKMKPEQEFDILTSRLTFEQCEHRLRRHKEPAEVTEMRACCMCDRPIKGESAVDWFTVIVAHRIKRACKACFDREPELRKKWMG